jgi:formylmethanofuran dehydrogenase subunit D
MTNKISLNMITCRTIKQGVGMEAGKTTQKYFDACSIIEMHEDDFKKLGIWKNTNVKVTSSVGSVIVKAVETRQDLYPGLCHIPMGPWANRIVPAYTFSTGEPCFKGFPVNVEAAMNEPIMSAVNVVKDACGLLRK